LSADDKIAAIESSEILAERSEDVPGRFPLSFSEQRLWFLAELEPQNAVYNICKAERIKGRLHLPALETSLTAIVRRHAILRTSFPTADGEPIQIVHADARLSLEQVDLSPLPITQKQAELERIMTQEARAGFDLASAPLFRTKLLVLSSEEFVWLFTVHQIIWDGWSFKVFYRELAAFYESYVYGKTAVVPELPLQFADYAVQQRKEFQGERLQKDLSFWRQSLSKSSHQISLPSDRPRLPRSSYRGIRKSVALSESLTKGLKELSRRQGATLFMTLLAAFTALLHRYSGQADIVVGCPVANRHRPEIENLIGSFVNTLALHIVIEGHLPFIDFLSRIRSFCLAAFAHQEFPFERLVEELQPERRLNQNPLFQIFFAFQQTPPQDLSLTSLSTEPLEVSSNTSKFDLTLSLAERNRKLVGFFEYTIDLFESSTIERMVENYRTLLEAIVVDPNQTIAALPILTQSERRKILLEWNDTAADYPEDKCIHQLFEEQFERAPEAIAVEFDNQQITYRDLNSRANQLAHHLICLGIGPKKLVGICVERSIEMVVGLMGILKAGGTYVPLEPAYPRERLNFMLKDSGITVLLTGAEIIEDGRWKIENGGDPQSSIFDPQVQIVCLNRDWPLIAQQKDDNPKQGVNSSRLAYVIYTSGSTGHPKGVQVSHRSVVNCLHSVKERLAFTEQETMLAVTTISFDISVLELFLPLIGGGTVVVASRDQAADGRELARCLNHSSARALQATPSTWRLLIDAGWEGSPGFKILCGGEAMPRDLADALLTRGEVWNLYGPTETTIWSAIHKVEFGEEPVPIGRPISNTRIYLLDSQLEPVPIGAHGEIYLGGYGLALGYWHRPELTAEKFVPNPFTPGERLYKTGDRARFRPDGNIEFVGRMDNQVKIRGHRVEPSEIEAALNQHPAFKESVVVFHEREPGGEKMLAAYLVPKHQPAPAFTELRNFLAEKLPAHMMPSAFFLLAIIPKTPNGKIDRNALPSPDAIESHLTHAFVEPRTQVEGLIAQVWREVLKFDRVGVHDSFFELGGHSLSATKVVSRISDIFHTEMPVRAIFQTPTIAGLAQVVERAPQTWPMTLTPLLPNTHKTPLLPAVAQEPLLRLERLFSSAHCFNIPIAYRLEGSLDVNALQRSLEAVVERHQVLRTTFPTLSGRQVQFIVDSPSIPLEIIDLEGVSELQREIEAKSLANKEAQAPFNLAAGPLLRVKLLISNEKQHFLLITMHHVISDGWSMNIFCRDLIEFYRADVSGQVPSLPELPIQYLDFSEWQRRVLDKPWMKTQLHFWKRHLEPPLPRLEFFPNRRRIDALAFLMARKSVSITGDTFQSLRALSQREEITLFMTVLTALNILLYAYTRQEDLRVATLAANRGQKETDNLIGHFVNSLIIRTKISGSSSFRQAAKQVRDTTLSCYMNQSLPFETLVQSLEDEHNVHPTSLCQVMLLYQNFSPNRFEIPGLTVTLLEDINSTDEPDLPITTFDLILLLKEREGGLAGSLIYKVNLFDEPLIVRMLGDFYAILRRVSLQPDQLVSELCCMAETQR
jgi:amino acid adenylation domain-containing protein